MALAAIFESPSDDEDFLGFAMSVPSDSESDDSRDSLASEDSGKPVSSCQSLPQTHTHYNPGLLNSATVSDLK